MGAGDNSTPGLGQYQTGSLTGTGVTIQFADGKIKNLGEDMAKQEPDMGKIETATKGIRVDFPGFGIVGIGLSYAHDQIKGGATDAISMARTALQDYRTALKQLDENYQKADKDNDGKISTIGDDNVGTGPGGPGGPGGIDPGKLSGVQPSGLDTKLPGQDQLDKKIPPYDLGDQSDKKIPPYDTGDDQLDKKIPPYDTGQDQLDKKIPGPNVPDPNVPGPDLPKSPSIEDQLNHNTPVPGLNTGTPPVDPAKTKLSAFDPTGLNAALPTPAMTTNLPDGLPTSAGGASSSPSGSTPGANAALGRGAGANGMSGMPFMPMTGGGAAGGEQDRERDKPEYVRGDENDWLDDMDIAPPVLGE